MKNLLRNTFELYLEDGEGFEYSILEDMLKKNAVNFEELIEHRVIYQLGKKREVVAFKRRCYEEILVKYLKKRIDNEFRIKYPNRNSIMKSFFDLIETLPKLGDYVIYKFDFKDFYNSLNSQFIFEEYFHDINIFRNEHDVLKRLFENFDRCYAGIATSNSLVEIISREFDENLTTELQKCGLVFYSRYVDDGIIVLSRYVSEIDLHKLLQNVIKSVFTGHKVALNKAKTVYLRKTSGQDVTFTYLGYRFEYDSQSGKFMYGIAEKKIEKFTKKYKQILHEYKKDNNLDLFKSRYEFLTSRVVFYNQFDLNKNKHSKWDVIGIGESYKELRYYLDDRGRIDQRTRQFLTFGMVAVAIDVLGKPPYFLKMKRCSSKQIDRNQYLLVNRIKNNRSIVFHPHFGWSTDYLVNQIIKLDQYALYENKSYPELVKVYCSLLKIKDVD